MLLDNSVVRLRCIVVGILCLKFGLSLIGLVFIVFCYLLLIDCVFVCFRWLVGV